MKVLLLNGSPHKEGCTYTALCEVEKTLNEAGIETEIFWVGLKPIIGCTGCDKCCELGKCVYDDDPVNEFVKKACKAEGFIFGSPVHYAGASGAVTSFLDRAFYSNKNCCAFKFKPAASIVSARRSGTTATFDQLNKYATISQMPIISSPYWNGVHGYTPDDVRQDEEGMYVMRQLGRNMAFFLKCIQAGLDAGLKHDESEKPIRTHFIR